MNYEGQICRAPMERASFMLPGDGGMHFYNRCKFCDLFKHLTYRELPLKQIEEELKRCSLQAEIQERYFWETAMPSASPRTACRRSWR